MNTPHIQNVQAILRVSLLTPTGEVVHSSDAGLGRAAHGEVAALVTAMAFTDLAIHLETYLKAVAVSDSLASIGRWGDK